MPNRGTLTGQTQACGTNAENDRERSDYEASGKLHVEVVIVVISGVREVGCALYTLTLVLLSNNICVDVSATIPPSYVH